jgi:mono/diheme cytochrome c family protein
LPVSLVATAVFVLAAVVVGAGRPDPVQGGPALFMASGCSGCHRLEGVSEGGGAPDLTNLPTVAGSRQAGTSAVEYVRHSIRDPMSFIVPGYEGASMPDLGLDEDTIEELAVFLLGKAVAEP